MIILKGRVPHTTQSYTKHSQKKKTTSGKEKANYASIKNGKAKACIKLSDSFLGGRVGG